MATVMGIVDAELSEPYSVFTYRYFIKNWPELCVLAHLRGECIGVGLAYASSTSTETSSEVRRHARRVRSPHFGF